MKFTIEGRWGIALVIASKLLDICLLVLMVVMTISAFVSTVKAVSGHCGQRYATQVFSQDLFCPVDNGK